MKRRCKSLEGIPTNPISVYYKHTFWCQVEGKTHEKETGKWVKQCKNTRTTYYI